MLTAIAIEVMNLAVDVPRLLTITARIWRLQICLVALLNLLVSYFCPLKLVTTSRPSIISSVTLEISATEF